MRSTLPLVLGVYGRVKMCLMASFTQSARKARDPKGAPLSVRTRSMRMFIRVNETKAASRNRQARVAILVAEDARERETCVIVGGNEDELEALLFGAARSLARD